MDEHNKNILRDFEDKYKKSAGRDAAEANDETHFLDKEALDADLTEVPQPNGDHGRIVSSEHPENEEWNAREEQNRQSGSV